MTLDDFRVKEEVVWHDDCTQHAHDDEHTAFRNARCNPRLGCQWPVDIHQEQFVKERQADDGNKGDNESLNALVGVGKEHDQHQNSGEYRSPYNRNIKEHFQGDGTSQNFGQRGGDGCQHSASQYRTGYPFRSMDSCSFAQAETGYNTQVGYVVLQNNEHDGGECHYPQKCIAKLRAGCKVRRPVARVDESYCYQQTGTNVFEDIQTA